MGDYEFKKKELYVVSIFLLLGLFGLVSGAIAQTSVTIDPNTSSIAVGDTLTVDVVVGTTPSDSIQGFKIILDYDESTLEVLEVTEGSLFSESGFSTFWVVLSDSDNVHVNDATLGLSDIRGPGVLFSIQFQAIAQGEGTLTFGDSDLRNTHNHSIPCTWIDGGVVVGVKGEGGIFGIPNSFSLSQNYPNPFNSVTQVRYALPKDCQVRLEVYNLLGQRVATLVDEYQKAGHRKVNWDGRDENGIEMGSGVYFCRLEAGLYRSMKKMILLR